jgi:3-oxoacyl-[acyl-carrier-protein] synthase-1
MPDPEAKKRIALTTSAELVASHFKFRRAPLVVSQACISGMLGIITGWRLIRAGLADHAVVAGADLLSRFILSGFQSFLAISAEPCRPFDVSRDGITLGEAAASVILSATSSGESRIRVESGSVSNDANHISGPSRTGRELHDAISHVLGESHITPDEVDLISAHGTATIYNDEMEANAIALSGLEAVPVNSLKGYYGHTLGAAGLLESIISMHSMRESVLIPTMGYSVQGTTRSINVASRLESLPLRKCLKTASGFGGCNAAILFSKAQEGEFSTRHN